MDVRIHDLSAGGCLVDSFHEVLPGRRLTLDIDLPHEGWITLQAETLYTRSDYGFAVRFVDVPGDTQVRLDRAVQQLAGEHGHDAQ